MNKTQPTPEEITAVVSEQPDLYQPTVQPLDAVQDNGYFPIEIDAEDKELAAPSLAKLATPSSDRNWLQRFKVAAKTAVSNIMNAQLTHNVALGNKKITFGKNKEEIEFGRRMASEAKRQIEEVMDGTEELTAEEAETWAAALGGGSVSMVEFAANLALLRGLGAGSVGAQLGAGWLAGRAGYEEGTMSDIDKYIAETGDKEFKNYKGDKKAFAANVVSGAIQGSIEAATSGLGRYLINNPLAKKVLGKTGNDAIRKMASTAVGRTLAAGANESVNNAFEEWTQALTGNIAEIVKGNEEFSMDNILNGAGQAAGVGALLGWVATPVMQEYGRRKSRDWISDKLRKASEEKGIPLTETEIKDAANDLVGIIESKGVQQVSDNYEKINQLAGAESDLAQTLTNVFEDLVNQGQIKFRQATPDEIRQAGLDWANYMQATALLDSLDREIPISAHPLFNAVAEADRIFLEGRDPGTGDLLPLDINNAQVRELANQIDDYIEQNRETRQAEEASKLVALREADMRARQETIQELERAAIAELEKEQAEKNQERITELQQQITELQHKMDLLREERSQYVKERAAQGRISIGRAKAQTTPDNKALTKKAIRSGNLDIIKQILQDNGFKTRGLSGTQTKQMAQLNWEMFAGKDLGTTKSKYDQNVAMKAIEQNVVSGDAVLLRAGYTQGQIDQMDDKTWNRALLAAYREETEALESVQPQLTPEQAAEIPDDLQYQKTPYDKDTIVVNGKERTVYNSENKRIAETKEELTNFWNWFGDSKVVDEQGRPLVVYHNTYADFDTFTPSQTGTWGPGIYMTPSKRDFYVDGIKKMALYAKIENPFYSNFSKKSSLDWEQIRKDGHDGIIDATKYQNRTGAINEIVAFEPNQIKHTENSARKKLYEYGILGNTYYGGRDGRGFVIFSGEDAPVQEKIFQDQPQAKLIATHNMSKEGLERALDLGGLVMPSMAITKFTDGPFTGYGEISFIGDAILANPTRTTDAYDRNAWTPMVNNIVHQFTEGGAERLKTLVEEAKQKNPRDTSSYSVYRMNIEKGMSDDPRANTMAVELFSILHDIPREQAEQNITHNWGEEETEMLKQYLEWYNDKLLAETKAFIYEGYTPSGKIRLKPLTLDNLTATLKKQDIFGRMTGDFFTPSDIIKMNLVRFKNIGEIRDAQGRLVPRGEAQEAYKEIGSDFYNLASELSKPNVKESDYTSSDQRLAWALIIEKGTLEERLAKQNLKNDAESVKKVKKFIKDVKNIKVSYFEVKPRRAVKFYEFSGVILPKGKSYDNLAARLEEEGVLNIYRATTPEEKTAALKDLTEKRPWTLLQNKKTSKSTTGLGTEHRGGYDPMTKAIIFNKTSDLTTLFHESAHYWFDRNLRYYRTGLASPEWKKKWEDVMNELGATPNARGTIPVAAIRSASEKFARSMEAYLREGKYESAAIQWAHQDYANMVKRVYRNIWSTYWGLDDLSPAVKQWFDMFGLKTDDATTAFAEEDQIKTDEQMVGAVIAEDATAPDVDAETKTIVADAGAQVVENPATQEIAVVPADPFETGKKARSKLPRSAEAATGVSMDDIIYNRRSMSDAFKAAQQLVNTDPVRAWEILKGGQEMVDGLYAGDIYRALVAKYQAENNPTMLKNVVQAFAGAARRAGRSVKAFDLESPRISFEKTINSLDKIFDTKKNDKRIEKVKNELKEFLHDPSALRVGWEEFKNIVGCK